MGEMLAPGGFGDACKAGLGRAPGEAPGLTKRSREAGAERQPSPGMPAELGRGRPGFSGAE